VGEEEGVERETGKTGRCVKKGNGKRKMEKRKIESFEDLLVWQKEIALVKQIYLVTAEGSPSSPFSLFPF
jgi:hypothetical protein